MTTLLPMYGANVGTDGTSLELADLIKAHEDAGTTRAQLVCLLDIELALASTIDADNRFLGLDEYAGWLRALDIEPWRHLQELADDLRSLP